MILSYEKIEKFLNIFDKSKQILIDYRNDEGHERNTRRHLMIFDS